MEKKAFKTFTIRVDNDLRKVVDIKAAQMHLSCGELIRRALKEYLYKDQNISNELLSTVQGLKKDLESQKRRLELHSSMFLYYLRFFFAFNEDIIKDIPNEMRKQFFDRGEKRRDDFINLFRNQKISRTNYLELLLGEFLAESVENKNEMSGIE